MDFLVVRDRKPWFLVEAKKGREKLSPSLGHFQAVTGASHAFQVSYDEPFVDRSPFEFDEPVVVSAMTLFSQLV